ncbi:DegT/DnrJ/EryC1/StrS family aminotransferase [Thermodesulfobacteriota bacterium]
MSVLTPHPRFRIYTSPATYLSAFRDLLTGGVNQGDDCEQLESLISQRFDVTYCHCTPQARVGIYLAIKALVPPGKKVILSPYTIADVINMVICAGAIPVFADIDSRTCNIDPENIETLIDEDTAAVMITHLHGLACPIDRIAELCKKHGLPLIEDAAQAFGATYKGRKLGTFGEVGIYSLGMYKNLIAFFGGMVVTNNQAIHETIKGELATWPITETGRLAKKIISGLATDIATSPPLFQLLVFHIFRFGHLHQIRAINKHVETELDLTRKDVIPELYLRRLSPMQARLALAKLDNIEQDSARRIHAASLYHEGLKDIDEIGLPPLATDGSHIYTYYPIQVPDRRKLVKWMMWQYRDIGVQHLKNCADLPGFKAYYHDCPRARQTADQVVLLPSYPRYSEDQVKRNIKSIRGFFT